MQSVLILPKPQLGYIFNTLVVPLNQVQKSVPTGRLQLQIPDGVDLVGLLKTQGVSYLFDPQEGLLLCLNSDGYSYLPHRFTFRTCILE